jgi:Chaperone of endosialidase
MRSKYAVSLAVVSSALIICVSNPAISQVTAVTASSPLVSSGGTTPNISLPGVSIGSPSITAVGQNALPNGGGIENTAIGGYTLQSNSGVDNTAVGAWALHASTSNYNTAVGAWALSTNTTGQQNTAIGAQALASSTTGGFNVAAGINALVYTTTGAFNTAAGPNVMFYNDNGQYNAAFGAIALRDNTSGSYNTAIGYLANVAAGNLSNATAIGANALVNASNKVRLGDTQVTVIEGQVPFTSVSDRRQKENFRPVNNDAILERLRAVPVMTWNYIGHDPKQFRHYGPVSQDFFGAFGQDEVGTIGSPTTINSGDMEGILVVAVQALERRTAALQAENLELKARLEALEHGSSKVVAATH